MNLAAQDHSFTVQPLRLSHLLRIASVVVLAALVGVGCTKQYAPRVGYAAMAAPAADKSARQSSTLAREHSLLLDVSESQLEGQFGKVLERCTADVQQHCTIMQSDLSSGAAPSGSIRLRIDPEAVDGLVSFVISLGKLEHRSTSVEDLADAIQDTQARIAMLTSYRKQLLDLQSKVGNNVEAAIKLASELSTVQTDLERASGEAAFQAKRTTTEIVRIEFEVPLRKAFWRPIGEAFGNFSGNFSEGISQAVTAVAYIVPWLFVVVPGLYLVRILWRRKSK
jgi:hypothetical protein